MGSVRVVTFGCRLNAFESEVIRNQATEAGLDDAVIVNTCAVTAEAERQARQAIRKLRRENPAARIIVTGCGAQLSPAAYADMPEVDRVLGNREKLQAEALGGDERIVVSDIMEVREAAGHLVPGFESRTRAFVQVQQGCDHRCTFCIIPFARGPNRSMPADAVVGQVAELVGNGYREVVLTGVDIASYGSDMADRPRLGALGREVLARVPGLARLRLTSLDPAAIDDNVFDLLADEPRFMPHVHLSLQAGEDLTLKRMRRRHSRAQAIEVADRLRRARPDVTLGADLIAGFPTESDEMFETTLATVAAMGVTFLHVFPFSARAGTPAARMPQVPMRLRKERAARLRACGDAALQRYLESRIGSETEVLVETGAEGRSRHYAPVRLAFAADPGALVRGRVAAVADGQLVAEAS